MILILVAAVHRSISLARSPRPVRSASGYWFYLCLPAGSLGPSDLVAFTNTLFHPVVGSRFFSSDLLMRRLFNQMV
jgi:hypothetical protein